MYILKLGLNMTSQMMESSQICHRICTVLLSSMSEAKQQMFGRSLRITSQFGTLHVKTTLKKDVHLRWKLHISLPYPSPVANSSVNND